MAVWVPNSQKLFLPPPAVTKVLNTDAYIKRTNIFCHADTERLLTVGNPFFEILAEDDRTVKVPKVSSNQYRVFRISLPDPNAFAFGERPVHDPDNERLVWGLRGIDVSRGQPLGNGVTGHPLFNKLFDNENPAKINTKEGKDARVSLAGDVKQTQVLIVGCAPAWGEHWNKTSPCGKVVKGECPPIELKNTVIQDGDMIDIGYGAMDFRSLSQNKSDAPLDIVRSICKYPDYLKMAKEATGDSMFFFARREQLYTRHFFSRDGESGEKIPEDLYIKGEQSRMTPGTQVYFGTQSGSLTSSDSQIFNRAYWLQRSQGLNNGMCWLNQLFVTVGDTTRGTNMTFSIATSDNGDYDASNFKTYVRHSEEFELAFIFQLCVVPLSPEVLAHLHTLNPAILDRWNLGLQASTSSVLEDRYRFLASLATPCPDKVTVKEPEDPYAGYSFWSVDLSERFSQDLDQFPLGRKFLAQSNLSTQRSVRKRARSPSTPRTPRKTVKRRKK
ncbi:major capsid protein [Canis familiaris papillomavirus 4]|uniref:Major capsid protein L1 n=4 Tax=Canis familiaris papillomavirus 4 TaxID=464980 RepID=A9XNH7_9PAPI|nr:major capsid protein [Canis familiaris papillomavirus 4]ABU86871.1 major capsid protein [Canis familiaris papillomavirus 4]